MSEGYLAINNISKDFGKFTALKDIDFSVEKEEFVCLLGPSGCGKTTLLRIIAGLEDPNNGSIMVNGKDITKLPPAKRNFGIVFQSYALFPNMTALQNIMYGLKGKKISKKEMLDKAYEVLALVNLEHCKDKYPAQLSGGQQQRIALARAIALSPEFLLLDEPLSALDAKVRVKLRKEIRNLQRKLGITTIMVTHDQEEALTVADKIVVMNDASLVQMGTPEEIYEKPKNPFVADFIGAVNFLENNKNLSENTSRSVLAIRPENIDFVDGNSEKAVRAVIKNIEFRGSFYRVDLTTIAGRGIVKNTDLIVDVDSKLMKTLKLQKNMFVSVELPEERLITYKDQLDVEYREKIMMVG